MTRFRQFLAIDWSGAKGARQKGIALGLADMEGGPPVLIQPPEGGWGREDVLALLRDDLPENTLVGMDLGIALPFADCGAFFPGWGESPADALSLWALIDEICHDDPNLETNSFVDHPELTAFFRRHGGREGAQFRCDGAEHGRGRLRVTEHAQAALGLRPYSNFNLVGAAQVGKSSLTGMRMLHRLRGSLPVWPINPLPDTGSVAVEIYTSLAAIEAGRTPGTAKMRSYEELNEALTTLGSPPIGKSGSVDDHSTDALITAVWLRAVAHEKHRWEPVGLTDKIARTEGWTFGA